MILTTLSFDLSIYRTYFNIALVKLYYTRIIKLVVQLFRRLPSSYIMSIMAQTILRLYSILYHKSGSRTASSSVHHNRNDISISHFSRRFLCLLFMHYRYGKQWCRYCRQQLTGNSLSKPLQMRQKGCCRQSKKMDYRVSVFPYQLNSYMV